MYSIQTEMVSYLKLPKRKDLELSLVSSYLFSGTEGTQWMEGSLWVFTLEKSGLESSVACCWSRKFLMFSTNCCCNTWGCPTSVRGKESNWGRLEVKGRSERGKDIGCSCIHAGRWCMDDSLLTGRLVGWFGELVSWLYCLKHSWGIMFT